jgi:hypothetical protein
MLRPYFCEWSASRLTVPAGRNRGERRASRTLRSAPRRSGTPPSRGGVAPRSRRKRRVARPPGRGTAARCAVGGVREPFEFAGVCVGAWQADGHLADACHLSAQVVRRDHLALSSERERPVVAQTALEGHAIIAWEQQLEWPLCSRLGRWTGPARGALEPEAGSSFGSPVGADLLDALGRAARGNAEQQCACTGGCPEST